MTYAVNGENTATEDCPFEGVQTHLHHVQLHISRHVVIKLTAAKKTPLQATRSRDTGLSLLSIGHLALQNLGGHAGRQRYHRVQRYGAKLVDSSIAEVSVYEDAATSGLIRDAYVDETKRSTYTCGICI